MKLLRRWSVQCICGSRSPGLWWSQWAAPVCTALCRSEAALTPRNHCCTCRGSPWCDPGPAEGCTAPPCLNRGSREDSGVLQSHGEIETKQRQNQMLVYPRIIEMDGKQVWDHKNPKYPACPIKLWSFFFFCSYAANRWNATFWSFFKCSQTVRPGVWQRILASF